MARHSPVAIPADLRPRLETARLDLLALFRALDRMDLTPAEIPQHLIRQLFELDADYVEALWGLDQPPGKLGLTAMLRDTLAALEQLTDACSRLRSNLPPRSQPTRSRSWKPPSAPTSIRLRLTIWSQGAIPKTVKHPDMTRGLRREYLVALHRLELWTSPV
jgi:hypothetical protein